MLVMFVLSLAAALVLVLAAPLIMSAYGRDFREGTPVLVLMVVATVLSSTGSVIGFSIVSKDRMWHGFWLNLLWATAFGVFVYLFIGSGAYGLALAYLLSYVVHSISSAIYMVLFLEKRRATDA
jgi:O-antigen/teichoic acid export membrane protein